MIPGAVLVRRPVGEGEKDRLLAVRRMYTEQTERQVGRPRVRAVRHEGRINGFVAVFHGQQFVGTSPQAFAAGCTGRCILHTLHIQVVCKLQRQQAINAAYAS